MAFPDYDYDLYEDFEDALGAGWTEVDPDNNINPQDTDAEYYGVQGMSIDLDGDTANKDIAYIYYDCGVDRTPLSLGFWWHLPSTTDTWWGGDVVCSVGNAAEGNTCLLYTSPSPRDATLSRMPSSA